MASPAHTSDSRLRKRFHLARLIVDGENAGQPLAASEVRDLLGVSRKTHTRDIERAKDLDACRALGAHFLPWQEVKRRLS